VLDDTHPPQVSVIIPAYNTTKYIAACLDSVLRQTFQDFEIVLVNDGCPDTVALERVLEPYQSRIRYLKQENRGLPGARNTAIRAARAPLILQLDADDILGPNCLEAQVRAMHEHPDFAAFYCNCYNFSDTPEEAAHWGMLVKRLYMDVYPSKGPVSFVSIMEGRTCPKILGSIIRRDDLLRIGLYDESIRYAEDLDMWLRLLKSPAKIGFTTEPLNYYRLRADSNTKNARATADLLAVVEKAGRIFQLTPEEEAARQREAAILRHIVALQKGKLAIQERCWRDAIENFEAANRMSRSRKVQATLAILRICPWILPPAMAIWSRWLAMRMKSRLAETPAAYVPGTNLPPSVARE